MEGQSGLSELLVILWVSAVEGCLLSRVPLCTYIHNKLLYLLLCFPVKVFVSKCKEVNG